MLVGRLHQARRRLLGVVDVAEDLGHFVAVDLIGQSVRTQDQPVAGVEIQLPHVRFDMVGDAEGAREDVPLRMDRCFRLRHFPLPHPFFGQAVIVGDLRHFATGVHVGPGVTDIGQRKHVAALGATDQRHGRECRAHAPEVLVGLALMPDGGIGLRERIAQPVHRRLPLEGLFERLDCDPRRHLAPDVATHAVGDGVEVRSFQRQILVDGADPSHVGG